jgi:hypothetical protein
MIPDIVQLIGRDEACLEELSQVGLGVERLLPGEANELLCAGLDSLCFSTPAAPHS